MSAEKDSECDGCVEPTTHYWQELLPFDHPDIHAEPPFRTAYPVRLPDGRALRLPLRLLPDGEHATASFIANQASFSVNDALAAAMAESARQAGAEVIVGMPTLGLVFAPMIARQLGHSNYVPLGYSRKFWYRDALSEPVSSITTPGAGKSVYIDPHVVPRLEGKRAVLVDDAISSGSTVVSVLSLLHRLDCRPSQILVAMRQGVVWRATLGARWPGAVDRVSGVFAVPLFRRMPGGWTPVAGTLDDAARP